MSSSLTSIPLMDLKRQYQSLKPEIDRTVFSVLESANFIGGPEKDAFEEEFAKALGAKHCIGVANGTEAITIGLKALGIGSGCEVITPANSFIASSEAITHAGARVCFVDVKENSFHLDLDRVEDLLKKRGPKVGGPVKAILVVHLYGRIADMNSLMSLADKYAVDVVEDTAQAHLAEISGKKAGTWGRFSTFSFYPGKNLGAYGDGGAICSQEDELALRMRKLANHGRTKKYDHDMEGFNSRLDALQAAILRVKLKKLPEWSEARRTWARKYNEKLASLEVILPEIPPGQEHVFHQYVIRVRNRDRILADLKSKGIEAGVHYPIMLPALDAYKYLQLNLQDFPVSGRLQHEILSLPLFPEMTESEQDQVVEALRDSLRKA